MGELKKQLDRIEEKLDRVLDEKSYCTCLELLGWSRSENGQCTRCRKLTPLPYVHRFGTGGDPFLIAEAAKTGMTQGCDLWQRRGNG
jgi:hypothetical protein